MISSRDVKNKAKQINELLQDSDRATMITSLSMVISLKMLGLELARLGIPSVSNISATTLEAVIESVKSHSAEIIDECVRDQVRVIKATGIPLDVFYKEWLCKSQ